MPNINQPVGLTPARYLGGSEWNGQANLYFIPQADVNAYFVGDLVKSFAGASNGLVQPINVFSIGLPAIVKAVAGDVCRGVIVGVMTDPNSTSSISIPAVKTHDYLVWVADDPDLLFEAQTNNVGTLATTNIGKNANFVVAAPTGIVPTSATQVNSATFATTNTLPLKVFGIVQREGNDFTDNAKLLVLFNTHEFKGTTGSSGV